MLLLLLLALYTVALAAPIDVAFPVVVPVAVAVG